MNVRNRFKSESTLLLLKIDSCLENVTICSSSAACIYDPILQDNICSCRDGFVGDGIQYVNFSRLNSNPKFDI